MAPALRDILKVLRRRAPLPWPPLLPRLPCSSPPKRRSAQRRLRHLATALTGAVEGLDQRAGKQPCLDWLNMHDAVLHCTRGVGIWDWASNDDDGDLSRRAARRHGEAVSQAVNGQRPLTPGGRRDVEVMGRAAAERGIQPGQIFHSGLLRARQTAEILSETLGSIEAVRESVGLRPDDDPAIAKAELETSTVSLMLVGHLPHMSRLASLLITGDPDRELVEFAPAAVLGLSCENYRWKILWKLTPAAA